MDAVIHGPGVPEYAGDLPVTEYTTTCSATQDYGEAVTVIPRGHPAEASIPDTGTGVTLTIQHGIFGPATYVLLEEPEETDWATTCRWADPLRVMENHRVEEERIFLEIPAGEIARRALEIVLASRAAVPFTAGTFLRGTSVARYEFTGEQSLGQVFADLVEITGEEWKLSADGQLSWGPPAGTLYEHVLVEHFDCLQLAKKPSRDPPVMRVVLVDQTGATTTADAPQHYGNMAAQTVVIRADVNSATAARQRARDELARRSVRPVTYTMRLLPTPLVTLVDAIPPPALSGGGAPLFGGGAALFGGGTGIPPVFGDQINHWSIQPGDFVRVVFTSNRRTATPLLRVMRRMFGDDFAAPVYELQEVPHYDSTTVHAARSGESFRAAAPQTLARVMAGRVAPPTISEASQIQSVPTARLNELIPNELIGTIHPSKLLEPLTGSQVPALDDIFGQLDPLAQVNWTHDTTAPTTGTLRYVRLALGGFNYKFTVEQE